MTSNVNRCFIAKYRMVESMLEDGYEVIVPKRYKWHETQRNSNFISKLNMANYGLLLASLEKLTKPMTPGNNMIKTEPMDDMYEESQISDYINTSMVNDPDPSEKASIGPFDTHNSTSMVNIYKSVEPRSRQK